MFREFFILCNFELENKYSNIMTKITLKGNPIKTIGKLPKIGKKAPKFKLVKTDLSTARLKDFKY